jgi:nicotinamidase-related amidase
MRQALLVIDVQRGLFDASPRPFEADLVVERINDLTARARDAGVPVILIQHENAGELQHGSANWALEQNLTVSADDTYIRKTTPDSFLGTTLQELLTARGIEQLVVCGYACEFCVDTTVRRAAALRYPVILAADSHTTHDKAHASGEQIRAHHNATLANIASFGSVIKATPAAEILFSQQAQ